MDLIRTNQSFSTKQNKMGFDDDDEYEVKVNKMMKFIPNEDEFGRMVDLYPDNYQTMLNEKPVFPYSQEEIAKMTKEEYRAAFNKWECETAIHYVHCRFSYDKFRAWNEKCLYNLYEDERESMEWLCDWIAKGKVRNMDMECCGEFHTAGFYFNENKQLVIYNGR